MRLVEQHQIGYNHTYYDELINITHLSKNLYNAGLYYVRQHFFKTEKYLKYALVSGQFVKDKNTDFYSLPSKVSQQTLKMVDQNFKSFFGLLKLKKQGKYDKDIRIPKYLDKKGNFTTTYTNQALSFKEQGYIKLSGTKIKIKTNRTNIQQVRIIPKNNYFVIEVIYLVPNIELKENNNRYASIDLGLSRLAAIGSNYTKPLLINGNPIKSMNQFYNKKKAYLQSKLKGEQRSSKQIKNLTRKRNNKIKDYLHKASTLLVNQLVYHNISHIFIGENKGWKQEINIGNKNNQNFVSVPFNIFKNMISYKAAIKGINVVMQEESYTSKASFLSNDNIPIYGKEDGEYKFSGYRKYRGLYKDKKLNKEINADINGAMNILRKAIGDFNYDPIEVCSTPLLININQ